MSDTSGSLPGSGSVPGFVYQYHKSSLADGEWKDEWVLSGGPGSIVPCPPAPSGAAPHPWSNNGWTKPWGKAEWGPASAVPDWAAWGSPAPAPPPAADKGPQPAAKPAAENATKPPSDAPAAEKAADPSGPPSGSTNAEKPPPRLPGVDKLRRLFFDGPTAKQ
jgi:hypothetical protein